MQAEIVTIVMFTICLSNRTVKPDYATLLQANRYKTAE